MPVRKKIRARTLKLPVFDLANHAFDVAELGARFEDFVAVAEVAPVENLDGHAAHAPVVHIATCRFVEVDCICPREGPPVIVHFKHFACGVNAKDGACRKTRPIGGSAVDCARAERGAERVAVAVTAVVFLRVRVSRRADFHDRSRFERLLVFRQWTPGASGEKERGKEQKSAVHWCGDRRSG